MDGKVILITGAAGTGKSTLVRNILERAQPFKQVDYGQLLREYKARSSGVEISYDELRRDSAAVITPEDVRAVDEWLIEQLPHWRAEANILIDSHPVTKESFGVRITPFSHEQVLRIGFDVILVLVADPSELVRRIAIEPLGRPSVDAFQAGLQVQLQATVAAIYAITCGKPCFALETTRMDPEEVVTAAFELLMKSNVQFTLQAPVHET